MEFLKRNHCKTARSGRFFFFFTSFCSAMAGQEEGSKLGRIIRDTWKRRGICGFRRVPPLHSRKRHTYLYSHTHTHRKETGRDRTHTRTTQQLYTQALFTHINYAQKTHTQHLRTKKLKTLMPQTCELQSRSTQEN